MYGCRGVCTFMCCVSSCSAKNSLSASLLNAFSTFIPFQREPLLPQTQQSTLLHLTPPSPFNNLTPASPHSPSPFNYLTPASPHS